MLWHEMYLFLLLHIIFYEYAKLYLFILVLIDIWVISSIFILNNAAYNHLK